MKGVGLAAIVTRTEIARSPEEVYSYMTDPTHLPEWQESVVSARSEGDAPVAVGSRTITTRRLGRREISMTSEFTELDPPSSWAVRGLDGPVRGNARCTIEPLGDGERSRVTMSLDFEGRGIGKLLIPLVVRRQAGAEMPRNLLKLKQQLEGA
jgi:uncharacterized protein YndB with AHSA1/START domain